MDDHSVWSAVTKSPFAQDNGHGQRAPGLGEATSIGWASGAVQVGVTRATGGPDARRHLVFVSDACTGRRWSTSDTFGPEIGPPPLSSSNSGAVQVRMCWRHGRVLDGAVGRIARRAV